MHIVILGPQGSGKGTQAALLTERYGFAYFAMGDALRAEVRNGTADGKQIKDILDRGELVPNEITDRLVEKFVKGNEKYIVDGYPRNMGQARFFDTITSVDTVLVITLPDDKVVERLSGRRTCPDGHNYHVRFRPPKKDGVCDVDGLPLAQRTDDKEEAIRKRLAIYHSETAQVIEHFGKKVVRVDGGRPIEEVHAEIVRKLRP